MSTTSREVPSNGDPGPERGERAMPRVRWPHPDARTYAMVGLWVVGLLVAVGLPALIAPPSPPEETTGEVALAFACTVVGALLMFLAGYLLHKRYEQPFAWAFGIVPAVTVLVGGVIMAATQLTAGSD